MYDLYIKHKENIEIAQRVDWSPRKRCKIMLLMEHCYSYEDIRRQIRAKVTKQAFLILKVYKEINSLQTTKQNW